MPLVFSYGTLQKDDVQLATFGRLLRGHKDELTGFEPSRAGAHANVTYNGLQSSRVSGTVFEITDAELAAADEYERRDNYVRVPATFVSGKEGWVYVDARSAPRAI